MQKTPPNDFLITTVGDAITLRLDFPTNDPIGTPVFLLNRSTESIGQIIGILERTNISNPQFITRAKLEEPGRHYVHAIWSPVKEIDLDEFETLEEFHTDSNYHVVEWVIHTFPEDATLDEIRQVVDDLIRAGTLVWGAKSILEKIDQRDSEDESDNEEADDDYLQYNLSNYD